MRTKWNQDHCEIRDYLQYELGFECKNSPLYDGSPGTNIYTYGEWAAPETRWRHQSEPSVSPAVLVYGDPYGKWSIFSPISHSGRGLRDLKKKIGPILQYLPAFNAHRTEINRFDYAYASWYSVVHLLRTNGVMPPRVKGPRPKNDSQYGLKRDDLLRSTDMCCFGHPASRVWAYDELKDKAALTGTPLYAPRKVPLSPWEENHPWGADTRVLWSSEEPDASNLTPGYKYHRKLVDVQWLPRDIYKIYQWKGWKLCGIESANINDVESDVWAIFEVPINTPDKEL